MNYFYYSIFRISLDELLEPETFSYICKQFEKIIRKKNSNVRVSKQQLTVTAVKQTVQWMNHKLFGFKLYPCVVIDKSGTKNNYSFKIGSTSQKFIVLFYHLLLHNYEEDKRMIHVHEPIAAINNINQYIYHSTNSANNFLKNQSSSDSSTSKANFPLDSPTV